MRTLDRPGLCALHLLLSSAAAAFRVPTLNYQSARCAAAVRVQRPATRRRALVMNSGRSIPELAALYEVVPLMTYDGWERDVESEVNDWVRGWSTAERIKERVEKMRRKQRLYEGDRSDAVLQVLDAATQGFTYAGWERDVASEENDWVQGWGTAERIKERVEKMRRKQRLHDSNMGVRE